MRCYCSVCDEAWIPHFATLMLSIARYDQSTPFFLFTNGLSDAMREKIEVCAASLGVQLLLPQYKGIAIESIPIIHRKKYSAVVWLKLFFPQMLPAEYRRAIYLDSDMVVLDDMRALFEIDLNGKAIAAVNDPKSGEGKLRLRLDPGGKYVNTGLMVIDPDRWRNQEIGIRGYEAAMRCPDRMNLVDQDAINMVAQEEIQVIDKKWNFIPSIGNMSQDNPEIAILHYAGGKPWTVWTPGSAAYYHFRMQTCFPFEPPEVGNIAFNYWMARAKRVVYKLLYLKLRWPVGARLRRNIGKVNKLHFDLQIRERFFPK